VANILHITNHGLHEWEVLPGLPDTGGQNVFVNHVAEAMVGLGHQVTIVNRGGYPHPVTGAPRTGSVPGCGEQARIVYLTDGRPEFVRKEDMAPQLMSLAGDLAALIDSQPFDLMISHYWDGAQIGILANERIQPPLRHLWIPHSLGALKRRNMPPETWDDLRIDERIGYERRILEQVDGVVSTSAAISDSLRDDYWHDPAYSLPPGVDQDRFRPREARECPGAWKFLADALGADVADVEGRPLIAEVSRTDATKRKDVLIRAFGVLRDRVPNALLAVTIDGVHSELRGRLLGLIDELGLRNHIAVLGSVSEYLPCLYAIADVYCTPSVMEGFGMSAAEAAATGVPVIASDRVPFVTEHLLGDEPAVVPVRDDGEMLVGAGGTVVPADSVSALSAALELVLTDHALRARQGAVALEATVPALTWDRLTESLLDTLGLRRS
jgi:mannosylfructose-phosphate synthase